MCMPIRKSAPRRLPQFHKLPGLIEFIVDGHLQSPPEDSREIGRRGTDEVAAGTGQRRERRLLFENIFDDELSFELLIPPQPHCYDAHPPSPTPQNVLPFHQST